MSKVDWSLAPEGATHWTPDRTVYNQFLKFDKKWFWFGEGWVEYGDGSDWMKSQLAGVISKPEADQPKPWSGQEDGLPPVGTVCEYLDDGNGDWEEVTIVAIDHRLDYQFAVFHGDSGYSGDRRTELFRAIPTPDQKRETAIRELMDIAQVDCRVTAARLVDAGFKREVV